MKPCIVKATGEKALLLIPSKVIRQYIDPVLQKQVEIKTLNLLCREDGSQFTLGDDDFEVEGDE